LRKHLWQDVPLISKKANRVYIVKIGFIEFGNLCAVNVGFNEESPAIFCNWFICFMVIAIKLYLKGIDTTMLFSIEAGMWSLQVGNVAIMVGSPSVFSTMKYLFFDRLTSGKKKGFKI
jgi:hypothetical protein